MSSLALAHPPRVPGASAQFAKVGVQSGPGQPIDICERLDKDGFAVEVVAEGLEADGHEEFSVALRETAALEREAAAEIRRLRAEERNRKVDLGGVLELLIERNGKVDLTSDVVSQVRALLSAERRAGIEAAAEWHAWRAKLYPRLFGHDAVLRQAHTEAEKCIRALADKPASEVKGG